MTKRELLTIDGLIGLCTALLWVSLLALARRAWLPDLDARWVVVSGVVIFMLTVGLLAFFQVAYRGREEREG